MAICRPAVRLLALRLHRATTLALFRQLADFHLLFPWLARVAFLVLKELLLDFIVDA